MIYCTMLENKQYFSDGRESKKKTLVDRKMSEWNMT